MMRVLNFLLLVLATLPASITYATQSPDKPITFESNDQLLTKLNISSAASTAAWELTGLAASITYLGAQSWDWGSSSFNMNSEGWFGMDTGSGGADKLGHLYTTYLVSEWLTYTLDQSTHQPKESALYGSLFGWGLFLYIEVFDGYSDDHGFSTEDLIMNSIGSGFSYFKSTQPWLRDKVDLRVEYLPSAGMNGIHPVTDYSGYKYLAVLKPAGFENLEDSFLKYFEFQVGYYTRGFKKEDAPYFDQRESTLYTAVSINLSELIFKNIQPKYQNTTQPIDSFFKYYQMPSIYVAKDVHQRQVERR
jgi:hypothetical protein